MNHETFNYSDLGSIRGKAASIGKPLPFAESIDALLSPIRIADRELPNRIAFQPMEGTDGTADGAPGELTFRRYRRFALGGPAVIWFEAVATAPEVRASAHQLMLTDRNLDRFREITDLIREISLKENGFAPLILMQATNSGRYSKPDGNPAPRIAYRDPSLESVPLSEDRILSDSDLQRYSALFGPMAKRCKDAGFDGMDLKCCHRYLASELLSAYDRPGRYGGSFENRTRFLKDAYRAARAAVNGDFIFTSRLNFCDGPQMPHGFGPNGDLSEAIRLVRELKEEFGIPLIDLTAGNPYKNPHVNRPYDHGGYVPDEHPLEGLARLMNGIDTVKRAVPGVSVIGSGFSYPRQFAPNLAAGMIARGSCDLAGFGRMAFAYPDLPRDLKRYGWADPKKVCITCGGCAQLLRNGTPAGCVIRDREVYHL